MKLPDWVRRLGDGTEWMTWQDFAVIGLLSSTAGLAMGVATLFATRLFQNLFGHP